MRYTVVRSRASTTLAFVASTSLALAGCDRLMPTNDSETMTLLKSGSTKVCTAADVQGLLRNMLLPKVANLSGGSDEDKQTALKAVSLSYDNTTLDSFDKTVAKATCNSMLDVHGPGNTSKTFNFSYTITPSAEHPSSFVVALNAGDATAFVSTLVNDQLAALDERHRAEEATAREQQARVGLMATVTERWLSGVWIGPDQNAEDCGGMQAMHFDRSHAFTGPPGIGRWSLSEDKLHVQAASPTNGSIDATLTITAADPDAFSMTGQNGTVIQMRRCRPGEIGSGINAATITPSNEIGEDNAVDQSHS